MKILKAILCRLGLLPHVYERVDHGPLRNNDEAMIAYCEGMGVERVDDKLHVFDDICVNCGKIKGFHPTRRR